ncbi:MAG TPA: M56 family metallopeptidase, partial [Pirellulales bacterium]|nr:M56 family metallopeptidase [Pirellulales bacterium]
MVGWFVETTVVAAGLAVVAAVASRFRPVGPTARHLLWLVVLLKLVTPPLLSWPWAVDWGHQSRLSTISAAMYSARVAEMEDSIASPDSAIVDATEMLDFDTPADAGPPLPDFSTVTAADLAREDSNAADPGVLSRIRRALSVATQPDQTARIVSGVGRGWLLLSALLGLAQAWRIIRFRDRLQTAVPAPDDLIDEAQRIAGCLGVRVPELLVVADLHTPLVWCLGRPKLLVPAHLVKTLGMDRWRAILIHELAHIRRGDHWVSRLELAAGLIWWWNPIYWLARNRLDAEAELACDAWVVSFLPKDRLAYAEALFDIFSTLTTARAPAPALGADGSGRLFERRLTMILHDQVSCRLSPVALLTACFLVLFAVPSWSAATPAATTNGQTVIEALFSTVNPDSAITDDDDDDDDAKAAVAKAKADLKKAEAALKKAEAHTRKAKGDAKKAKKDAKNPKNDQTDQKDKPGFDFSQLAETIEKELEGKLGPDFEKRMEELG